MNDQDMKQLIAKKKKKKTNPGKKVVVENSEIITDGNVEADNVVKPKAKRKYNKRKIETDGSEVVTAEVHTNEDVDNIVVKKKSRKTVVPLEETAVEPRPNTTNILGTQSSNGIRPHSSFVRDLVAPNNVKRWKGWAIIEDEPEAVKKTHDVIVSQEAADGNSTRRSKRKR
ncbi:hypothetical protein DFH28DRAFT_928425 [Melampsora americana]|nr:hypothetical protein DFH28DRAFT_928425 [Melampsora americana]